MNKQNLQEIVGPAARLSVKKQCNLCFLWFPLHKKTSVRSYGGFGFHWLPDQDSNLDKLNQNQLCYHYTIGHCSENVFKISSSPDLSNQSVVFSALFGMSWPLHELKVPLSLLLYHIKGFSDAIRFTLQPIQKDTT